MLKINKYINKQLNYWIKGHLKKKKKMIFIINQIEYENDKILIIYFIYFYIYFITMNIYINKHTREDFCSQILQFYRVMNKIWKNIDYYHMSLFVGRERGKSCLQFQVG